MGPAGRDGTVTSGVEKMSSGGGVKEGPAGTSVRGVKEGPTGASVRGVKEGPIGASVRET